MAFQPARRAVFHRLILAAQLGCITPFFDYPPKIRRIIYTTNVVESVRMSLRKINKNRGLFTSDERLLKLIYLAMQNISRKWKMSLQNWKTTLNRLTIMIEKGVAYPLTEPLLFKIRGTSSQVEF